VFFRDFKMRNKLAFIITLLVYYSSYSADFGQINGNISIEAQTYSKDSLINAPDAPEKILSNSWMNLYYRLNQFEFGLRFEAFLNPIYGIDPRYKGTGIAYKNITYKGNDIEISAGNFYEQFGNGLILRSYYDPQLGIDNSIEGAKFLIKPFEGIAVKGLIGTARKYWTQSSAILRAGDIDISLTNILKDSWKNDYNVNLGFSFVSKYEEDNNPTLKVPLNEFSYAIRLGAFLDRFQIQTEAAFVNNHPTNLNQFSYNQGNAFMANITYLGDGYGAAFLFHRIDNFDLRIERNARGTSLTQNYIPSITKQHLFSKYSILPYSTQLNGEIGFQFDFNYFIPENTFLGGKYGGNLSLNFSQVNSIRKNLIDKYTYDAPFFEIGDTLLFRDINIEYTTHLWSDIESILRYAYITNNKDILFFSGAPYYGKVYAHFLAFENSVNLSNDYGLHIKFEHMWQTQDSTLKVDDTENGNWFSGLAELTIKSKLLISGLFDYNYGNKKEELKIVYYNFNIAYLMGGTRISVSYGRNAGGILCVGGVCRAVPATNGFFLSLTSSF